MGVEMNEQWYQSVLKDLDTFCKKVDEKVEKEQQRLKASKKQNELEYKVLQEKKINTDFSERQSELNRHYTELDRICATFESRLTIADNDKHRLENAKETYQLAKELTGIRLDFSAPSNVAKGYIKSESRRLLQPFELEYGDSEAVWTLLRSTTGNHTRADKENRHDN